MVDKISQFFIQLFIEFGYLSSHFFELLEGLHDLKKTVQLIIAYPGEYHFSSISNLESDELRPLNLTNEE